MKLKQLYFYTLVCVNLTTTIFAMQRIPLKTALERLNTALVQLNKALSTTSTSLAATTPTLSPGKIFLLSKEGTQFEAPRKLVLESDTIEQMLKDTNPGLTDVATYTGNIETNVNAEYLQKVVAILNAQDQYHEFAQTYDVYFAKMLSDPTIQAIKVHYSQTNAYTEAAQFLKDAHSLGLNITAAFILYLMPKEEQWWNNFKQTAGKPLIRDIVLAYQNAAGNYTIFDFSEAELENLGFMRLIAIQNGFHSDINILNAKNGQVIQTLSKEGEAQHTIEFSPDGKRIVTTSNHGANLWDRKTGELIKKFPLPLFEISSAKFSPDGKLIMITTKKMVEIMNIETGNRIISREPFSGTNNIISAEFNQDGKHILISESMNSIFKIWNIETDTIKDLNNKSRVPSSTFSPDGKTIATISGDYNILKIWHDSYEKVKEIPFGSAVTIRKPEFSPNSKTILIISVPNPDFRSTAEPQDTKIEIFNVTTSKKIKTIKVSPEIRSAKFSPDGKQIVTANLDGTIEIWDVLTGKPIRTLKDDRGLGLYFAEFSPVLYQQKTGS